MRIVKCIFVFSFIWLALININNKCFADTILIDTYDDLPVRDTSVMQNPTVGPQEEETEIKTSRTKKVNSSNNQDNEDLNQKRYYAVGIVLLLFAAIDALIIIRIAKNKKKNK